MIVPPIIDMGRFFRGFLISEAIYADAFQPE
jgi:hypothetical protein